MSSFKHDDDTCPHLVRASLLEAENARLKAEVERLKNLVRYWSEKYQNENARFLRADDMCKKVMSQHSDISCDNIMLRKAGDAMASALILFEMKSEEERQGKIKAWTAAKEGKPSA